MTEISGYKFATFISNVVKYHINLLNSLAKFFASNKLRSKMQITVIELVEIEGEGEWEDINEKKGKSRKV